MENLFLVLKILTSIVFFVMSFVLIYLCTKAEYIKDEFARLEKLITKDLVKIYQTGSTASKIIIELVLAKNAFNLRKFL